MNIFDDLISRSNLNGFKIIKTDYIPEKQQIIQLKIKQNSELFFEVLDLKNRIIREILLDEKICFTPYSRIEFHPVDEDNFYLSAGSWHLKINSDGKIALRKPKQFESVHILKNYIFREDLTLTDLKDFKEYDLTKFFDENFDEYEFMYFYYEGRSEFFSSSDSNILTVTLYCKDRDDPKFLHVVLNIHSHDHIDILYSEKIDQLGHHYVINENLQELAFENYLADDKNLCIRKLSNGSFNHSKSIKIEDFSELIFFNDEKFILLFDEKIEIWERNENGLLKSIPIDRESSYKLAKNILFYIKDTKLNYIEF